MIPAAVPWWVVAIGTVMFGCVGFLSVQWSARICATIQPFADGPRPGNPPSVALIAGAAVFGGVVTHAEGVGKGLLLAAILIMALVGCWYSDVRCGIVPDYFTLVPLVLFVLLAVFSQRWLGLLIAAVVTMPFAISALFSQGIGMGWGDVKLVALGAVVLEERAILACAAACLAAVIVAMIRKRRTEPIAFAPYLVASIALAASLHIFP